MLDIKRRKCPGREHMSSIHVTMKCAALLGVFAACLVAGGLVQCGIINPRLTISFNSVMDTVITSIQKNASAYGLNPYNIKDVNDTFKFGIIHGGLYLKKGQIYGIDTIFRNGNTSADVQNGHATVEVLLGFKELSYSMEFAAKVGDLGPTGKVHGDITMLDVEVVLLADMRNSSDVRATLSTFQLTDDGELTVHFDNDNPVAEALLDVLTGAVTKVFKGVILDVMSHEIGKIANNTISQMHIDLNSLMGS
ncbi:uncharacterized protein LOC134536357 [Bacillus rossius redtenbacheri]|uniref:uncharacterized protein LOC134536357 n=1 Tax=Bacillus rossius redtenbacheri TaxID=93214 RepID=UPI002FDEBD43